MTGKATLEEFRQDGKLSEWASRKVRECRDEVEAEDEGRLSIAQDTLRRSTDFLGRFLAQSSGARGVTLSYVCPHCHCFPLEDYTWWVSAGHGQKPCSWWCAACGGQYDWRAPNRILVIQDSTDHREAKVSRAHHHRKLAKTRPTR